MMKLSLWLRFGGLWLMGIMLFSVVAEASNVEVVSSKINAYGTALYVNFPQELDRSKNLEKNDFRVHVNSVRVRVETVFYGLKSANQDRVVVELKDRLSFDDDVEIHIAHEAVLTLSGEYNSFGVHGIENTLLSDIAPTIAEANIGTNEIEISFNEPISLRAISPKPKRFFPQHSWEKVPLSAFLSYARALTEEEITKLADRYDVLTLAIRTRMNEGRSSAESGIYTEAQRIKAVAPSLKIFHYLNFALAFPAYHLSLDYEGNEDVYLHDVDGAPLLTRGAYHYDYTSSRVQNRLKNFIARRLSLTTPVSIRGNLVERDVFDGIFIDALPKVLGNFERTERVLGATKAEAVKDSLFTLLDEIYQTTQSEGNLIIFNGIRASMPWEAAIPGGYGVQEHTNGAMVEHFNAFSSQDRAEIEADIEYIKRAGLEERLIVVRGWPGFSWKDLEAAAEVQPLADLIEEARAELTFPLALFLVAAQEHAYLDYSWGYREDMGNLIDYAEFSEKLGAPLGQAKKTATGYTREFAHASISVNLESRTASIEFTDAPMAWSVRVNNQLVPVSKVILNRQDRSKVQLVLADQTIMATDEVYVSFAGKSMSSLQGNGLQSFVNMEVLVY